MAHEVKPSRRSLGRVPGRRPPGSGTSLRASGSAPVSAVVPDRLATLRATPVSRGRRRAPKGGPLRRGSPGHSRRRQRDDRGPEGPARGRRRRRQDRVGMHARDRREGRRPRRQCPPHQGAPVAPDGRGRRGRRRPEELDPHRAEQEARSVASIYEASTGGVVQVFDEFDADFVAIQGDGAFGLFWASAGWSGRSARAS